MDTQKIILIAAFMMTSMMLWQAWDKHNHPDKYQQISSNTNQINTENTVSVNKQNNESPSLPITNSTDKPEQKAETNQKQMASLGSMVNIKTNVFDIQISTQGADIRKVSLLDYPIDVNHNKNPVILID